MNMIFDKEAVLSELKRFLTPVELMSTAAEAQKDTSIPIQWKRFIDERILLLREWNDFSKDLPGLQNFLQTIMKSLYILREQNGTLSLLYLYTVGVELNFYRGRLPDFRSAEAPPTNLEPDSQEAARLLHPTPQWMDFSTSEFYGPLPIEDWAFLSEDRFDIDEVTARNLRIDICKTVAVFHNGSGDYLCLNCGGNAEVETSGIIWSHEDPANPELVDFWGVLDAWIGIFLEEADRKGA